MSLFNGGMPGNEILNVIHCTHDEIKKKYGNQIRQILFKIFLENNTNLERKNEIKSMSNDEFLDECLGFLDDNQLLWFILIYNNKIISLASCCLMLTEIFLFDVCTLPEYRGNGYAKFLLFQIKKYGIKHHNITGIKGNVDNNNIIAQQFYTKYGAIVDTNFSISSQNNNQKPTNIRMLLKWKKHESKDVYNDAIKIQRNVIHQYYKRQRNRMIIKSSIIVVIIGIISYSIIKIIKIKKYTNKI